jgi:Protein of unknown function (DUF2878)
MHRFLNALGFQLGWWACVAGVGVGLKVPALVFCLALTTALVYFAPHPMLEIKLAAVACLMGVVLDTGLQYFSIISFYGWSLSAAAGFLFGPLTYYAGAKLGAASFDNTLSHFAVMAMTWMVALPGLVWLAKCLAHKPSSPSI